MSFSNLFFVVFVLSVAAYADSPLCRILHGVAQPPQTHADGFRNCDPWIYVETWMTGGDCSSAGNTFDIHGGKMSWGSIQSSIPNITFSNLYIDRYVHATYDPDTQSAKISAGVKLYFSASHISDPKTTFDVEGYVGFDISNLPLAMAGRYDPIWHGEIHTVTPGPRAIIDTDLFDGHVATVLLSRSTDSASSTTLSNVDKILSLAADANLRLVHFDAVPTAIGNDLSARLAFMRPSSLPPCTAANSYAQPDYDYSVVWNSAECVGSNCDSEIVDTLTEFAAADSRCTNPTVVTDSVHGRLWTTMLINSTHAQLHSAHAMSKAVFRCSSSGEDGYISISLEAISTNETSDNVIDVKSFLADKRAAVLMTKNGRFKVRGYRNGYVKVGDDIYTPSRDDMFGPGYGGVFFKDYPLTENGKDQFISFMNAFILRSGGGAGLVNTSLDIYFEYLNATTVYYNYLERTTVQTQYSLLSYFTTLYEGLNLVKSNANDYSVTLSIHIRANVSSYKLDYEREVKDKVQPYLNTLFNEIKNHCGKKCNGFNNPPNMSKSSYFLARSYLVLVGDVEVTLKPSGLDGTCIPDTVDLFRSATFYSPVSFRENDAVSSLDLEYTTNPVSVIFTRVRTKSLNNIPNQMMYYSPYLGAMYDDGISLSNMQYLLTYIKQIANDIKTQEYDADPSLRVLMDGASNDRTLSNALVYAANSVPLTGSSFTLVQSFVFPFRAALRSYLSGADAPFGAFDVGVKDKRGTARFYLYNIRKITPTVSGAHWCRIIDVTRAPVKVPLTYSVTFRTGTIDGSSSTSSNTFSYSTYGYRSSYVSLPLRDGMRVGHLSYASASLSISLPSSATYTLSLSGQMERGGAISGTFKTDMIQKSNSGSLPTYPYSFEINEANNGYYNQGAEPEQVMASFVDILKTPQEISVHRLTSPLAPLAKALSEIVNLGDEWEEKAQWVYSITPFAVLAQSPVIDTPTEQEYSQQVTFTLNNKTFGPCTIKVPQGSQWPQVVTYVASSLYYCGDIRNYVTIDFQSYSSSEQTGYSNNGAVVIHPRFPGSIYSFSILTTTGNNNLFLNQTWHEAERIPDFLSWNDMYKLVYAAFLRSDGYKFTLPQLTTVSSDKLVPESRKEFYPKEFNAVYFPAKTSLTRHAKNVPLQTEFRSSEDSSVDGNGALIKIPEGSVVPDVEVKADVEMMFGVSLWCALGDGTLTMGTGFDDSCADRTLGYAKVPNSPNNTFVFTVLVERRNSHTPDAAPELISLSKTITLVSGKLVGESLIKDMPSQLDSRLQRMINITLDGDGFCADKASILMKVSPRIEEDNLYVPLRVEITDSRIAAIGTGTEAPATIEAITACPITKDMSTQIDVKLHDNKEEDKKVLKDIPCTGSVGILGLSHCKANIEGHHVISASNRMQNSMVHELRGAVVDDDFFDEFYENGVDFDTSITLSDLAFDVAHNGLGSDLKKEKIVLSKVGTSPVVESKDYSLSAFSARATTPILNGLLHTSQEDFCRGVEISQSVAHSFVSKDEMKANIPFTEQSLAPVYTTLVEEPFRSVHRALCEKRLLRETVTTTSEFCQAIKRHWGSIYLAAPTSVPDICGAITLNEEGLTLPLSLKFADRHASAPFYFDANRVSSKDVVFNGYGPNGNVELVLDAEATFGIKFGFNQTMDNKRGPVTLDKDASRMIISTHALPNNHIRTVAGSVVVDIDASDIQVDTQVRSEFTKDIKHTESMSRDIYDWDVEDKSVLLRDGSNEYVKAVVSGNAHLGALASNDKTIGKCKMDINVPHVSDFYHPSNVRGTRQDTVQYGGSCVNGGDLIENVADAADFSSLAKYFESDADLFSSQMIKNITKDLIDILVDDITNRAIGFLGKHIQELTHKIFDDLVGDDVAEQISDDIKDIVENIIKKGQFPNATDLEREVLRVFSGVLNKIFKDYLLQPINTPDPTDPRYVWQMRFGKTTQIAAKDIDWSLGDHGYADLEVATNLVVSMAWTASFDVVWTKGQGVTIEWPVSPAFSAKISVDGANLDISGSLLFVTADIAGTFAASGELSGNPFKKDITFKIDSSLNANGKLGLVGIIRQKTAAEKKNSLQTLPYVTAGIEASWSFIWGTSQTRPSTPASWKFVKPQLCLGSLFTEFLQKATHEIDRVVKPLEPVFGRDGILLKPIPGLSQLFGKKCNVLMVLEIVCELFSSKSCNVKAVRNIIHVIEDIADDIDKLHQFEQWLQDPYGCNDMMLGYPTFGVNWTKDKPEPEKDTVNGGPFHEKGALSFGPNVPEYQKAELSNYFGKWNDGVVPCIEPDLSDPYSLQGKEVDGNFGITLDILQDFPAKFMVIILGGNVEMLSVHFPKVSFSFGYDWSIPIYSFPYIAVVVGFEASVSFQPPTMILTSKSLTDTIATGNPSYLFRDVGIATNMSFVHGSIEVAGGIEGGISVLIFKATVSFAIYIQFNVGVKVTSITGQDFETIDSLGIQMRQYGFFGLIDFDMNLKAGVRLALRACINVFFFKKCWTLLKWQTDTTLWDWRPAKDKIPDIAPYNGEIDGKHVDFIYKFDEDPLDDNSVYKNRAVGDGVDKPTYYIGVKGVMLLPKGGHEANAALTKSVEGAQTVKWASGTECTGSAFKVIVAGDSPRQNTILPSCSSAEIEIVQNGYHEATKFQISKTSVVPDSRPGVTLGSQASSLFLSHPDFGVSYEFVSAPSYPVRLEGSTASKVSFTGSSNDYSGGSVTLTSKVDRVNFDVTCSQFAFQNSQISCDNFRVITPDGTRVYRNGQRV